MVRATGADQLEGAAMNAHVAPDIAEAWQPVRGYPGYEVSDLGRVRSWRKPGPGGHLRPKPIILSPCCRSTKVRYLRVSLRLSGNLHVENVHFLVLEAFAGPRPPGLIGLHNDGDHLNNTAANLRWGTHQDNADDRAAHGTTARGAKNSKAKLSEAEVRAIVSAHTAGSTQTEIATKFGVTQVQVSAIVRRKSWSHLQIMQEAA